MILNRFSGGRAFEVTGRMGPLTHTDRVNGFIASCLQRAMYFA